MLENLSQYQTTDSASVQGGTSATEYIILL